jgi:hypothetical protein
MRGFSTQLSYTWSKNLGTNGTTDPTRPDLDYGILSTNRPHNFSSYGSFDLPFGPNGLLLRNSTGILKKAVEGWQLSWTGYMSSGLPMSLTTLNSLWGSGQPDLVRPDIWNSVKGKVVWVDRARYGNYWSDGSGKRLFMQVNDPACATATAANNLQTLCNSGLKGLASVASYDANGNPAVAGPVVFQMPTPGVRGNYDMNKLMGPGTWGLDLAASKNIEFMEGKSINIRLDVQNVLNHDMPSGSVGANYNGRQYAYTNPITNLNDTVNNFGVLVTKGGHRTFSAKMRINF